MWSVCRIGASQYEVAAGLVPQLNQFRQPAVEAPPVRVPAEDGRLGPAGRPGQPLHQQISHNLVPAPGITRCLSASACWRSAAQHATPCSTGRYPVSYAMVSGADRIVTRLCLRSVLPRFK